MADTDVRATPTGLQDQVAVVVGAGPGIGMAVARRFAREGFRLGLITRDPASLDVSGLDALPLAADVTDPESLTAALAQVRDTLGAPTVLHYNPSYGVEGTPSVVTPEQLVTGLRVSVVGAAVATQAVLPGMRAAGRGSLLFTGSGTAVKPWVQGTVVSVSKAALRSYVLALAAELRPEGLLASTLTIHGVVKPGTHFDPELIAEEIWRLHAQGVANPPDTWLPERDYRSA